MPKYEVRLESQTDEQFRLVTITTDTEASARLVCEEKERDLCAYSLDTDPYLAPSEITSIRGGDYQVLDNGKVKGPVARYRGKLHADLQEKPYKVVEIRNVDTGEITSLRKGKK